MLEARTFKMYKGYCHILLDKIIFTETEEPVEVNELREGKNNTLRIVIYSIAISILVAGVAIGSFSGSYYRAAFCGVIAIALAIRAINWGLASPSAAIYKSAITKISFKPFIYSVQNSHFIVHYKYDKDIKRKRIISLAGSSAEEIQNAINIMEEEFGY